MHRGDGGVNFGRKRRKKEKFSENNFLGENFKNGKWVLFLFSETYRQTKCAGEKPRFLKFQPRRRHEGPPTVRKTYAQ